MSTTIKYPFPRHLNSNETLSSLDNWIFHTENYCRREATYREFMSTTATWDSTLQYYGLQTSVKSEALQGLLRLLASFLPTQFQRDRILSDSKCLKDVWDIYFDHYQIRPSQGTYIQYLELKRMPEERYLDFYGRMEHFTRKHLSGVGAKVGSKVNTVPDKLTISHLNQIALDWMERINPSLPRLVLQKYTMELNEDKVQLADLVPRIAQNAEAMIKECKGFKIDQPNPIAGMVVSDGQQSAYYPSQEDSNVHWIHEGQQDPTVNWFQTTQYGGSQYRPQAIQYGRGRGQFSNRGQMFPRSGYGNQFIQRGGYPNQGPAYQQDQSWRQSNPTGRGSYVGGYTTNHPNQTCTHCQLLNDQHGIPTIYTNHVVLDCPRIKAGLAARAAGVDKQSVKIVQGGDQTMTETGDKTHNSDHSLSLDFTQLALGGAGTNL